MTDDHSCWTLEHDDHNIAWLGLDCPGSTNVISGTVLTQLGKHLDAFEKTLPAAVIIYSHKESGFAAGADINELADLQRDTAAAKAAEAHAIVSRLADLSCTTLAVLNGTALGGGLELALACDHRILFAGDRPVVGLPEVQLGLQPGLGGTVRAPQLIGVRAAMELMLTGKPVRPDKALRIGLVDALTNAADWHKDALAMAQKPPAQHKPPLLDRLLTLAPLRPLIAGQLTKTVARKARREHYPAPYAMIELWRKHGASTASLAAEAESFVRLAFTPTARNLIRVFFMQTRLKGFGKKVDRRFEHAHVVGAGTMGADIAAWCAMRGLSVTLQDREKQYVDNGLERARKGILRKYRGDEARTAEAMQRIVGDHTGEGARSADIIIEAIFEDLAAKQALFADLESRAKADAVLASNTSSIPLEQIAEQLRRPARLIGIHFFNPVALMPLVEVVAGTNSAQAELDAGLAFTRQIGKLPLPCKGLPGFLVNRVLAPYLDEAFRLYLEGHQPESIDQLAVDFGMPVGPLELADNVGIDVLTHVAGIVADTIGREASPRIAELAAEGRLGEKSGHGIYRWNDGKAVKEKPTCGLPDDAADRLMLSLVNEAANCLADGVVEDADLADAGTIFGSGFAPFRGGPIQYARDCGLADIRARLDQLAAKHGERFTASPGWEQIDR